MSDKPLPQRKTPRLQGYDYASAGAYFITICTFEREHLFGQIHDGEMALSPMGDVVVACWAGIAEHFPTVEVGPHVVMPNHMHGIIVLPDANTIPIGRVVGAFKAAVTRDINRQSQAAPFIWQRGYHDHIIRNEADWQRIVEYIANNPARWSEDTFYSK